MAADDEPPLREQGRAENGRAENGRAAAGDIIDLAMQRADRAFAAIESKLARDSRGRALPIVANAVWLIARVPALQGLFRHDVFSDTYQLMRTPPPIEDALPLGGDYPRAFSRADTVALQSYFQMRWPARWARDTIEDAMLLSAALTQWHPVRAFLDGLAWDGVPRLDGWLHRAFGAPDDAYHAAVGSKVLIAAVRRVRRPGCKFDNVLVIEGKQGQRKSWVFRVLAGDWYSDRLENALASKDAIISLNGVWMLEIAEIEQILRNESEDVKAFLSRAVDRYRPPYGRTTVSRARQGILVGTTNQDAWLRDASGNRRFWPVRAQFADVEWMQEHRDQLWAEASAREAAGEAVWLDATELEEHAGAEQAERLVEDAWTEAVQSFLTEAGGRSAVTVGEVIDRGLALPRAQQSRAAVMRVADILKDLGWLKRRARMHGRRVHRWYAPGTLPGLGDEMGDELPEQSAE